MEIFKHHLRFSMKIRSKYTHISLNNKHFTIFSTKKSLYISFRNRLIFTQDLFHQENRSRYRKYSRKPNTPQNQRDSRFYFKPPEVYWQHNQHHKNSFNQSRNRQRQKPFIQNSNTFSNKQSYTKYRQTK